MQGNLNQIIEPLINEHQADLLATLAEIVGRPLGEGEGLDSIGQLESFTGSPKQPVRESLILSPWVVVISSPRASR